MNKIFETALQIALTAHSGQTDKAGMPYILHPLAVAAQLDSLDLKIVALLHDTIEDTDVTADYLLANGIPEHLVRVVEILTRPKEMSYEEYLHKVKTNPMALAVKKADLAHNTSPSRRSSLTKEMAAKYEMAKNILFE